MDAAYRAAGKRFDFEPVLHVLEVAARADCFERIETAAALVQKALWKASRTYDDEKTEDTLTQYAADITSAVEELCYVNANAGVPQ